MAKKKKNHTSNVKGAAGAKPAAVDAVKAPAAAASADVSSLPSNAPSAPPRAMSARISLRAETARDALFFHDFQSAAAPFRIAKGMTAANLTDEDGAGYLTVADGAADAKSVGAPEGYALRLPDEAERAASGNRIIVRAVARAAGGGKSRFALAYSTNEVGNSGWRWFPVSEGWTAVAFEFPVNPMIRGNGDFVAILAEPAGKPGVDVCCISVAIIPKAAAG